MTLSLLLLLATQADLPKVTVSDRTTQPLLKPERPYEDVCLGYFSVLKFDGKWHLWYEAIDRTYKADGDRSLCYAVSSDGVKWQRPDLGLIEYAGSKNNNIVLLKNTLGRGGLDGCAVFLDEGAPPTERLKMVYTADVSGHWWVFGAVSPDGLRWKPIEKPLLSKNSDTQTMCVKDGDLYRLYVRQWTGKEYEGTRIVGYTESKSFGDFPAPETILRPDAEDPKNLHFYTAGTSRLGPKLYAMFPSGFYTGEDVVRVHLALSRDGKSFRRPAREPLVDLGKGFDSKGLYVAPQAIPGAKPGTFWVYYLGTSVKHDQFSAKTGSEGGIGRFLVTVTE
jgi:hypothetical protein